jgi:chaperonin GroEL
MGATLIKEAARNTVREAGDGTTTAIVLAEALIKEVNSHEKEATIREIKEGINSGLKKVNKYLKKSSLETKGDMLQHVSSISCNNDMELGKIIAEAYTEVGKDGVVLMEGSDTENTYVEVVDGIQMDSGLTSPHFVTDTNKQRAVLENPLVLIVASEIPNVRKIQNVLEFAIKNNRSLLIVAQVSQQVKSALLMNKVKGTIKVNIVDLPGFGPTKQDTIKDLAILTGAEVINEELGDDLDGISLNILGEVEKAVTDDKNTIITTIETAENVSERIKEVQKLKKNEKNDFFKKFLEQRLAMLSGSVGIIRVGADSKVELKEKKDRVEDAIYATKAALKEGIVPGGGIALLNASQFLVPENIGETILFNAIKAPFKTILRNAGIEDYKEMDEGVGIDVITGKKEYMLHLGIIDPLLVTKTALKNAVSVVSTIASADCVISNIRIDESS